MQDQDRDYLIAMLALLGYIRVEGAKVWGFDQYKISYEDAKIAPAQTYFRHPRAIVRQVVVYQKRTHVTLSHFSKKEFVGRHDEVAKWLKTHPPTGDM